jgi:hypothetical protein
LPLDHSPESRSQAYALAGRIPSRLLAPLGLRVPPIALVVALAVIGPGLTFFAEGGIGRLVGVVCLLAAVAMGAVFALAPDRVGEVGED